MLNIKTETMHSLLTLFLDEGFRATLDSDSVISLKIDGGLYIVGCDLSDPGFYQMAYPSLWTGENINEKVLAACDFASQDSKFAKCYTMGNKVHCVVHTLAENHAEFYKHFHRYLSALKYCSKVFYNTLER